MNRPVYISVAHRIRQLHAAGYTRDEIAADCGVSQTTVYRTIRPEARRSYNERSRGERKKPKLDQPADEVVEDRVDRSRLPLCPSVLVLARHHPEMIPDEIKPILRQVIHKVYEARPELQPPPKSEQADTYRRAWSTPAQAQPYGGVFVAGEHIRRVVREACARQEITYDQLMSTKRSRAIVRARIEIVVRLTHDLRLSTLRLGRLLGRDHSSIINLRQAAGRLGWTAETFSTSTPR